MLAKDIMTRNVVTAKTGTRVRDIAKLMTDNRISALPVVTEDGALAGLVSEGDLLHRKETGTERKRAWWMDMFADSDQRAREFVKAHGLSVEDVMTRVVVSVPENASAAEVADILDAHRIRRVPVVTDGKVVGIISRGDLVRVLAQTKSTDADERIDNGALHKRVYDALHAQPWMNTLYMNYTVSDGVVQLVGFVDTTEQKRAIEVVVSEVSGVKRVDDQLRLRTWQTAV